MEKDTITAPPPVITTYTTTKIKRICFFLSPGVVSGLVVNLLDTFVELFR